MLLTDLGTHPYQLCIAAMSQQLRADYLEPHTGLFQLEGKNL